MVFVADDLNSQAMFDVILTKLFGCLEQLTDEKVVWTASIGGFIAWMRITSAENTHSTAKIINAIAASISQRNIVANQKKSRQTTSKITRRCRSLLSSGGSGYAKLSLSNYAQTT